MRESHLAEKSLEEQRRSGIEQGVTHVWAVMRFTKIELIMYHKLTEVRFKTK